MLFGCATPLTIESDGNRLAAILGIEHEDVRFISYCTFDEIRRWEKKTKPTEGIVALTRDDIRMLGGDLRTASTKKEIRIPISEIEGIDIRHFGRGRQLQLIVGEHLIVLEVTANKQLIDQEGSQRLYDLIISSGAPTWESEKYYLQEAPPIMFIPIILY